MAPEKTAGSGLPFGRRALLRRYTGYSFVPSIIPAAGGIYNPRQAIFCKAINPRQTAMAPTIMAAKEMGHFPFLL